MAVMYSVHLVDQYTGSGCQTLALKLNINDFKMNLYDYFEMA